MPVRPVRCWYCGQQMHYSGHVAHEPEVRLTLDTGDADETLYLHARCWNDWQARRRGEDEYEAGYAHGMRDAATRGRGATMTEEAAPREVGSTEGLGPALEDAAYACLSALAGVDTDDVNLRDHGEAWAAIEAFAAKVQAAERERLLSMPTLMHACDALGAPPDGEHCALLRAALYRA